MGILYSPFATTKIFAWGVEVIMGDRKDEKNIFLLGFNSLELSGN